MLLKFIWTHDMMNKGMSTWNITLVADCKFGCIIAQIQMNAGQKNISYYAGQL